MATRKLLVTCRSIVPDRLFSSAAKAAFLIFLTFIMEIEVQSQGNLLITPRRLVFEGSKRSMDINLANTGQDTASYAISWIQIRMKDDGGFEKITDPDPGQLFADRFLRIFPRSVKLGPNESQVVKVQLIRSNELQPGEYRSHLYFRAITKTAPLGEAEFRDSTSISVRLTPVFGITIPVIIRYGNPTFSVSLSDMNLTFENDTTPRLSFKFNRSGGSSVFGDISIDYISPQGTATRVGIANGVAIYTPNSFRNLAINLTNTRKVNLKSGKLVLKYSSSSDLKPVKYAEAEYVLR
jgi:P pilus assembly chaperone PapD